MSAARRASRSRWYQHAAAVIRRVLAEAEAQGLTPDQARRLVDAAYPFGVRENHPYAMWLRARRDLLARGDAPDAQAEARERRLLDAWNRAEPIHDPGPAPELGKEQRAC